ncbi:MAG: ABC transporter permease [Verrucomicrobiae bacterium]|nr:ABC transporter permease [Verrucomicrobiae bacterium]
MVKAEIVKRPRDASFWITFSPAFSWLAFFYLIPLLLLLVYAFLHHDYVRVVRTFTLENFIEIFSNPGYRNTLFRTFRIATLVTLINAIIALPAAYFIALYTGRFKNIAMILLLLPLWSSYLVRIFAWRIILGYNGVLNSFLTQFHFLQEPTTLFLYNQFSMTLTLCYIWLPFMALPLIGAFERLPKRLLEAAADLGASGWIALRRVILPLILPGLLAGGLSVFSLTIGDYITPLMVGGAGDILAGNIVASQFGVADNWPLGAAFATVLLIILFFLMSFLSKKGALENL